MSEMLRVIGIDPALTVTGISDGRDTIKIETDPHDYLRSDLGLATRINYIMSSIRIFVNMEMRPTILYVEEPIKHVGANHLYEMGWWMAYLYRDFALYPTVRGIVQVDPRTLKHYITGNGGTKKKDVEPFFIEKYGFKFDDDRGKDKLHAYALHRFGLEHQAGIVIYEGSRGRGEGARTRAAVKKRRTVQKKVQ